MRYFPWKWTSAGLAALALSAAGAAPAAASTTSADTTSPVVGHVYTDGNTTATNTVDAFDRHRLYLFVNRPRQVLALRRLRAAAAVR